MKYLKTFEFFETNTGQALDYSEGDIVICVDSGNFLTLDKGASYKVLKLYKLREDKMLGKPYMRVDVQDIETGYISKGYESTRFKLEVEVYGDKYNL